MSNLVLKDTHGDELQISQHCLIWAINDSPVFTTFDKDDIALLKRLINDPTVGTFFVGTFNFVKAGFKKMLKYSPAVEEGCLWITTDCQTRQILLDELGVEKLINHINAAIV